MRGKEEETPTPTHREGITPAYAGKRHPAEQDDDAHLDHPRVCGEKTKKVP